MIKSKAAATKAAFNNKTRKNVFASKLDLNLRNELLQCYTWSIALYGAETWTLRKVLKCGAGEGRIKTVGQMVRKNFRSITWRLGGKNCATNME